MNILGFDISKAEAAAKDSVEKGWITSSRFIGLIAFVVFVYFAKSVFTTELFIIIGALLGLYMICNTTTRIFEVKEEGLIIRARQKLAWADGVLTEAEAAALNSADSMLNQTVAAPVVPTPKVAAPAPATP